MKLEYFKRDFKRLNGIQLCGDWVMWRKPFNIWNEKTDETIKVKNLDQALDIVVEGKTVREHIEALDGVKFEINGSGGSSSGGKDKPFKFTSASEGKGKGKGEINPSLLPAYANTKIKTKSYESALAQFSEKHRNSDTEFSYSIDDQGFVHSYEKGGSVSVMPRNYEKKMIVHNHPAGSDGKGHSFSKADMQFVSRTNAKGIVAVAPEGTYSLTKTHKFKGQAFEKAMSRANPRGKDYSDAVGKWLTANQDKYGYKYTFTKAKKSKAVKSKVDVKKLANGTAKQLDLF